VREIHHDEPLIGAIDDLAAECRQRRVLRSRRSAAQSVALVVGQLEHAHAHVGKKIHAIGAVAERLFILEAVNKSQLTGCMGAADVAYRSDLPQRAWVFGDAPIPLHDVPNRELERIAGAVDIPEREVQRREAG